MKLPGTAAYRFAASMGHFYEHDSWDNDFGAFIAAIHNKDTAHCWKLDCGKSTAH
jgi:hypothetical protein